MNDSEKLLKIRIVLQQVADIFDNAITPGITRQEWIKNHDIKTGLNYNFSLTADDIIKNKIPRRVVGCTGIAKVFGKLAKEAGLECFVVSTANYEDWKKAKEADKNKQKRNIINGHQIIAVQFSDGLKAFEPANPKLEFINGEVKLGKLIKATGNTGPDFLISAISTPDMFANVKEYQNIVNLYTSGDMNNDKFIIKPEMERFKSGIKNIKNKTANMFRHYFFHKSHE